MWRREFADQVIDGFVGPRLHVSLRCLPVVRWQRITWPWPASLEKGQNWWRALSDCTNVCDHPTHWPAHWPRSDAGTPSCRPWLGDDGDPLSTALAPSHYEHNRHMSRRCRSFPCCTQCPRFLPKGRHELDTVLFSFHLLPRPRAIAVSRYRWPVWTMFPAPPRTHWSFCHVRKHYVGAWRRSRASCRSIQHCVEDCHRRWWCGNRIGRLERRSCDVIRRGEGQAEQGQGACCWRWQTLWGKSMSAG